MNDLRTKIKMKIKDIALKTLIIAWIIAILIFVIVFTYKGVIEFLFLRTENIIDILLSQVSVTFLVLSIFSLFGNNGKRIYWIEVMDEALNRWTMIFSICSLFSLMISFCSFAVNCVFFVSVSYAIDIFFLTAISVHIIDVFWDSGNIERKLSDKFDKNISKREYYLNALYTNTLLELGQNNWCAVRKNIEFFLEKGSFQFPIKILSNISADNDDNFMWIYNKLEDCKSNDTEEKEREMCLSKVLDKYIETSIKSSGKIREELLEKCIETSREIIERHINSEILAIAYEVASMSMKGASYEKQQKRKLENKLKACNKHVNLLMLAYISVDYDTIDWMLDNLFKLTELPYFMTQSKFEEDEQLEEYELEVSNSYIANIDIFSENETKIFENIIFQEQNKPILNLEQIKILKDLAGIENYEPSDEEIEMYFWEEKDEDVGIQD